MTSEEEGLLNLIRPGLLVCLSKTVPDDFGLKSTCTWFNGAGDVVVEFNGSHQSILLTNRELKDEAWKRSFAARAQAFAVFVKYTLSNKLVLRELSFFTNQHKG